MGQDGPLVSGHRRWMKKKLQENLELQLVRDNDQTEQGFWKFEAAGANRMVYRSTYCSEGLVAKLNPHDGAENRNLQEFNSYCSIGDLGGLLTACHGLATCSIGGAMYDILILDRIAFTVEALLQKQHQQSPNQYTVPLVAFVIWKIVDAAATVSGPEYEIDCVDWHTQNLAISEGEDPAVKLIDWVGHSKALHKSNRTRMHNAMNSFLKYLPCTQEGVDRQWTIIMRQCTDAVRDWWGSGAPSAVVPEPKRLQEALQRLAAPYETIAGSWPELPLTSATRVVPTERSQSVASTLSEVTVISPPCSAPAILQAAPATKALRSDRTCSSESRFSAPTLDFTIVGNHVWTGPRTQTSSLDDIIPDAAAALRSLTRLALEAQRKLLNSGVLHGKKRGPNSWDMASRIWYGHFDHHIPTQPTSEVLTTGLLFKILLQEIETAGLHDRIDRNARGEVIRAARDGNKLHGQQGKPFMQSCQPPWTEMSSSQRLLALRCFMRQKFSIDKDKRRKVMLPCPFEHWERAEISWGQRFFMTEDELKVITQTVIDTYERIAPHMYQQ